MRYLSESPKLTPNVTFRYDAAGNRVTMSESDGSTTVRATTYTYDQARRLTAVGFDHDGSGSIDETVSYAYDAGGLRTTLTLPGGLSVTYTYDAKGQLIRLSDWNTPEAQTTRFDYDRMGRLRASERANGLRSQYTVDAGGRLRRLRHQAGSRTLAEFVYTVDKRGNRTEAGELVTHAGSGTTTLDKDHAAVEVVRGVWVNSGDFKTSVNSTATLKMVFSGDTLNLTMGTGADHSLFDLYIDHSYWDSIDGYAASNGEQTIPILLSDDGAHVLEIRNRCEKNGDSTGYRVRFKQLEVNRQYDLHLWMYSYDALSRVAAATLYPTGNTALTPLRAYQYAFDLAGNRLSESVTVNGGAPTVTSFTYNAANQISSAGFSYDANGNLTGDGANMYVWDRANRLLTMGGSSYTYDGVGNRMSQTVGADATKYLLDVQPGLAVVLSATTGATTTRYVHSLRGIHAQQDSAGNWEWMINDGLGSVRGVAANDLTMLESRLLDPYGKVISGTGTNQTVYHRLHWSRWQFERLLLH